MKKINIFSILVLILILVSCKKENMCDCIKTAGKTETRVKEVSGYSCIWVEDKIDVFLKQGNEYHVEVEAGANLQPLIKVETDGETLKVVNKNRCNWVRGYKHKIQVTITAPRYKFIGNNGVGTISCLNTINQDTVKCKTYSAGDIHLDLQCQAIICSTHGDGDIYLTGTTNRLENDFTGTNFLYAKDLHVNQYIYLQSSSIGHAYVTAPSGGLMDITINRKGNIYYYGNPSTIHLTKKGDGNLIQLN